MLTSAKSCMQFNGYEVNNIQFSLSQFYEKSKEFQISPTFDMAVTDLGDDKYEVQIMFSMKASDENPLPFNMEVVMTGNFSICLESQNDELKQTLLHENAIAIMFPFLRSIIASLTTAANIPPLILPVINLVDAFKNNNLSK